MLSSTEENYLKALLYLTLNSNKKEAGTNEIANYLGVKPATANDMLKRLKEKKMIRYEKYGKISFSEKGKKLATEVMRRHRLWETFLYEKLEFTWDEVHEVAEQLEHIQSDKLVDKLDKFLNYPKFDPHGDVIPNAKGEMLNPYKKTLAEIEAGKNCKMVAVKDNTAAFLQYVVQVGLVMNNKIKVIQKQPYDSLMVIEVDGKHVTISEKFAENILVI
jgi:DtxR family transcriptional regulator, Mn-dependent transcriptional regulator